MCQRDNNPTIEKTTAEGIFRYTLSISADDSNFSIFFSHMHIFGGDFSFVIVDLFIFVLFCIVYEIFVNFDLKKKYRLLLI